MNSEIWTLHEERSTTEQCVSTEDKISILEVQLEEERQKSREMTELKEKYKQRVEELEGELKKKLEEKPEELLLNDTTVTDNGVEDINIPECVGIRFANSFKDFWSTIDRELKASYQFKDKPKLRWEETVHIVYHMIKVTDTMCIKVAYDQFVKIVDGLRRSVDPLSRENKGIGNSDFEEIETKTEEAAREYRKNVASLTVSYLQKTILRKDVQFETFRHIYLDEHLEKCINECVHLIWMMYIQQPSMELVWATPGENFNNEQFEFIGKTEGRKTRLTVWPAVFLHKNGPLVAKGHSLSV